MGPSFAPHPSSLVGTTSQLRRTGAGRMMVPYDFGDAPAVRFYYNHTGLYFRYFTYHTGPYCHTAGTSCITLVYNNILQVHHILHWSMTPYFRYLTHYTGPYFRYVTYHTGPYCHTVGTSHITLVHTSGTSHIILVLTAILQVRHISHWFIPPYFDTSQITLLHTTILQVRYISHWSLLPYFRYVTYYTGPYRHTSGTSHVHWSILQVRYISYWSIATYFRYFTYHTGL